MIKTEYQAVIGCDSCSEFYTEDIEKRLVSQDFYNMLPVEDRQFFYVAPPATTPSTPLKDGINQGMAGEKRGTIPPKPETEAEFQSWLITYAKLRGWKVAHFRGGWSKDGKRFNMPIQGDAGFPDIVLARNGEVRIIELKSDKGALSKEQKEWLVAIGTSNSNVFRPKDREMVELFLE